MPREHLIELMGFVAFEGGFWFDDDELITLRDLKSKMLDAPEGPIRVRLTSPGGVALAGTSIAAVMYPRRDDITVEVLGMAGSAASVIALAGSRLEMTAGSFLMIHEGRSGLSFGMSAAEHAKEAEILGKLNSEYAGIYASHSDLTVEAALEAMADETWYTAEEAVAAGFADEATEGSRVENEQARAQAAQALAESPWTRYVGLRRIPPELTVEPRQEAVMRRKRHQQQQAAPQDPPNDPEDGDPQDGDPQDGDPQGGDPQGAPATAVVPQGMVLVSQTQLTELQASVNGLAKANERLTERLAKSEESDTKRRHADIVEGHLQRGAINPADRDFWLEQLAEAEASTVKILEKLPDDPSFKQRGSAITEMDDGGEFHETTHGRQAAHEMGWDMTVDDDLPDAIPSRQGEGE